MLGRKLRICTSIFIALGVGTLMWGCSSPQPDKRYVVQSTESLLPKHANNFSARALQLAYLDRGLIIDQRGVIVPADLGDCLLDIYWLYTPASLVDAPINSYSPLYTGIALYTRVTAGAIYLDQAKHKLRQPTLLQDAISSITAMLTPEDTLVIDAHSLISLQSLVLVHELVRQTNLKGSVMYKVASNLHSEFSKQLQKNEQAIAWIEERKSDKASYTINSTKPSDGVISRHYHSTSNGTNRRAKLSAIEVEGDLLTHCRARNHFIGAPLRSAASLETYSDEELVLSLPSDANFSKLSKQRNLLEKGQYLASSGKINALSQGSSANSDTSYCQTLSPSDPDYKYCRPTKKNSELKASRKLIVIGDNNES